MDTTYWNQIGSDDFCVSKNCLKSLNKVSKEFGDLINIIAVYEAKIQSFVNVL